MRINIRMGHEYETITPHSCECRLVNEYRYLLPQDFAEYLKGYQVEVKRVSDGTNSSPTKVMLLGCYLNLAFYAEIYTNQYGYKSDATIICEVVYKTGEVAMPYNTYEFSIERMHDKEVEATLESFIKLNKKLLDASIIHHSANTPEMVERMENKGLRVDVSVEPVVAFEYEDDF